jgi:hypothetical protein
VDDTIDEIKIDVEDPDELCGAVLEAARCTLMVNSGNCLTFMVICTALGNSERPESIWSQLGDGVMRENVVDRLRFLSRLDATFRPRLIGRLNSLRIPIDAALFESFGAHFGRLADRPHPASTSLRRSSFCGAGWPWSTIRKVSVFLKFLNEVTASGHFTLVDDMESFAFVGIFE